MQLYLCGLRAKDVTHRVPPTNGGKVLRHIFYRRLKVRYIAPKPITVTMTLEVVRDCTKPRSQKGVGDIGMKPLGRVRVSVALSEGTVLDSCFNS